MVSQSRDNKRQSAYDEIYDRCQSTAGAYRAGIKYERLAALVFKSLEQMGAVIHDQKLIGDSKVKSQIDVVIEDPRGSERRILIECKDFDISGENVDISIVRCFWAVVDDIKPTDAMIITCNGFTEPAIQYAAHKQIKLAILRKIGPDDHLIENIHLNLKWTYATDIHVEYLFPDESTIDRLKQCLSENGADLCSSEVYLDGPAGSVKAIDFLHAKINEYRDKNPDKDSGKIGIDLTGRNVMIKGCRFPINAAYINFDDEVFKKELKYYSDRIAALILNFLKNGSEDLIIFRDDLERFKIDPATHEVIQLKSG